MEETENKFVLDVVYEGELWLSKERIFKFERKKEGLNKMKKLSATADNRVLDVNIQRLYLK